MIGRTTLSLAVLLMFGAIAGPARAQSVTAAFQDFSGHSKQPVRIEADRLDVRQSDQAAVFSGRVVVVQGTSTLRTKNLTIDYYDTDKPGQTKSTVGTRQPAPAKGAGLDQPKNSRDIRRLTAVGDVVVTSGDQRATGARGVFDMASNTVVLSGGVTLTQGENVLRGSRLVVDLTTQHSRLESSGAGGRVQGVFVPGQGNATAPGVSHRPQGGHAKP